MIVPFDVPQQRIFPVRRADIRLDDETHPFGVAHRKEIERNWSAEIAAQPRLFNGPMVLLSSLALRGDVLQGVYRPTDFATFMYWRMSRPPMAEHCFAHAMPVASDNALIAVRMGGHTANASRVYFAAGSFEPSDFDGDRLSVEANMAREVAEETGLVLADADAETGFHALSHDRQTVIFRRYRFAAYADTLAARIAGFVAADPDPEITGPVVLRTPADLPPEAPGYMKELVHWHFGPV